MDIKEAANVGEWFEASLHRELTVLADNRFADGYLTKDQRKALSSAVGKALDAFRVQLQSISPELYTQSPWVEAPAVIVDATAQIEGAEPLQGEFVPLVERAVRSDGTVPVRLISPGWGSSGYYSKKVLQRDVPKAFPAGTLMFWDHPTEAEESARPEGSLANLAAVLTSAPRWKDDGMYAEAKMFGPYREALDELAPHIGVSIRALGRAKPGSADGQKGMIVEEIATGRSVDFVTSPGAGGRVAEIFEAARTQREWRLSEHAGSPEPDNNNLEVRRMDELKKLQEANDQLIARVKQLEDANVAAATELGRLREGELLRRAKDFVAETLASVEMPEITRQRLIAQLSAQPIVLEADRNTLDLAVYRTKVLDAAKTEVAYLAEATGAGKVTGMGPKPATDPAPTDVQARMAESFRALGLTESAAKVAANGR